MHAEIKTTVRLNSRSLWLLGYLYQDANVFKSESPEKLQMTNEHPVGNVQEGRIQVLYSMGLVERISGFNLRD